MALDENDKKEIAALFAAALAGDDAGKLIGKHVGAAITGLKLDEKFAGIDKKLEDAKPKEPDPKLDPKPDPKAPSIEDDPAYKKAKATIEELSKNAEKLKKQAEDAEAARRQGLLETSVRDALLANGADPARVGIALNQLKAIGAVKVDDNGAPVFVVKTQWGDENQSPVDGAKVWLGTDEGKFFVPASTKQGTGDSVHRDAPAPRTKDGKLDWSQLPGRVDLSVLSNLGD